MRWSQIIEDAQAINSTVEELWPTIERECSEALAAMRYFPGDLMYRGINGSRPSIFHDTIRTDREPRDIPMALHQVIDQWMADHGFQARRSNSLFVSSDRMEASMYGTVYLVFPKNGFNFTWFYKTSDLYRYLKNIVFKGKGKILWDKPEVFSQKIDGIMEKIGPMKTDLTRALGMGHEIMISDTSYYAFNLKVYGGAIYDKVFKK